MQNKPNRLALNLFIFIAILAGVTLVALFREGNSPRNVPVEYEKTQQPESRASTKSEPKPTKESVERPGETAKKLVRAWNQGSNQEIANLFTSDGVLTIPNGSQIQSKSEIEKMITEKRDGLLKQTTLSNTVDEVSQIDPDTAVVKGKYQLEGIKVLGFSTAASGTFVLRQFKREGKWLISRAEVRTGDG